MTLERFEGLISCGERVIIIFSASWCGPCKILSNRVSDLTGEKPILAGLIFKEDIEDCPEIVSKYNIQSVPTVFYISRGSYDRKNGLQTVREMGEWFD